MGLREYIAGYKQNKNEETDNDCFYSVDQRFVNFRFSLVVFGKLNWFETMQ